MRTKLDFAKNMLNAARLGAQRAPNGDLRDYATREERRWEGEISRLMEEKAAGDNHAEQLDLPAQAVG